MTERKAVLAAPERVALADFASVETALDADGCAVLPKLLQRSECDALVALYERDELFRSRVVMAQHGYGAGEYKYFQYPLPELISGLREALYSKLSAIANRWNAKLGVETLFPNEHQDYIDKCHAALQTRPTPLLLRYGPGDYNCLHQDLYGELVFPLQVAILLSEPERDFEGGEFVLTEQRPRRQSKALVVPLRQGDGVVFAVNERPAHGTRGVYRVKMRHGVSRLRSGQRHTLGIIFHDAT
jgi:hypothetical protein